MILRVEPVSRKCGDEHTNSLFPKVISPQSSFRFSSGFLVFPSISLFPKPNRLNQMPFCRTGIGATPAFYTIQNMKLIQFLITISHYQTIDVQGQQIHRA